MPSRGYRETTARYVLAEQDGGVFVVAIQLYDKKKGQPVDTLPNNIRFFARVIEQGGRAYVDLGDYTGMVPFDSTDEARQYIHMLFELEDA